MKKKNPKEFCVNEYSVGDRVRLFGTQKQCVIIYIKNLKKYFVFRSDGETFDLEESHYYRIRSVQRNNKIIAKRKSQNQELIKVHS